MTVVIVGSVEVSRTIKLATMLHDRGANVVVLESVAVIALLLLSKRVGVVVVQPDGEVEQPDVATSQLSKVSPKTRMLFVAHDDPRSAEELAVEVLGPR